MLTRIACIVAAMTATAAMAATTATTAPAGAPVKVGDMAPGISAGDQRGGLVGLPEFRGHKFVVVYFYPKDFTAGCTLEAQRFAADYPQFASRDAVVIGISRDPAESHKEFCGKYDLPFTLLTDADGQIGKTFGAGGPYDRRCTFLVDKAGKVIYVNPKVTDIAGQDKVLLAELDKAGASRIGPQVGKVAPEVMLPAQSSNQVWTLSSERGRTVVLTFLGGGVARQPADVQQAKALEGAAGSFGKAGATAVTIYAGTQQQAGEFARKAGLTQAGASRLLVDAYLQAGYAYNVLSEDRKQVQPATFVIDKDGIVRWVYVGKSDGDRPSVETVLGEVRK